MITAGVKELTLKCCFLQVPAGHHVGDHHGVGAISHRSPGTPKNWRKIRQSSDAPDPTTHEFHLPYEATDIGILVMTTAVSSCRLLGVWLFFHLGAFLSYFPVDWSSLYLLHS